MRLLDAMPEVEKTSVFGTAVHGVLRGDRESGPKQIADRLAALGVHVAGIAPVQPSLEDVFLEVVEQAR
jgi:hypothetical protein